MERVQVLIDRLTEQQKKGESAAQLLVTVQLLQQELSLLQQQTTTAASKKIAVIMPAQAYAFTPVAEPVLEAIPVAETQPEPVQQTAPPLAEAPQKPKDEPTPQEQPKVPAAPLESYRLRRPSITELMQDKGEQKETPAATAPSPLPPVTAPLPQAVQPVASATPVAQPHFDVLEETPTLLQHTPQEEKKIHREINQIIHGEQRSLNDQLKQQKTEVAHLLQEAPIKDLRKAIGINDKFVFLNDLFNGDEAMYERSIKTINNFHVLQEAEYWINRELKLRLGWNDTRDSVQHFYQLVRRRFS